MKHSLSRRNFLKAGLAAGAVFNILPRWVIGKEPAPNSKINVAIIGCGGRGSTSVHEAANFANANIAALCDVDSGRASGAFNAHPEAKKFSDYREMFDKMGKDIDAVFVCTPDHAHFPAAAWAMANGKHVYVEKPLARTFWETRELKRIAKKTKLITQLGNQGHAGDGWRLLRLWSKAGLLGDVEEIHHWTDRPNVFWRQGLINRPDGSQKPPSSLDWKLWLNVAPDQPYANFLAPFAWRGFQDFGTSSLGDMGCHFMDLGCSAFDLGLPSKIRGSRSEMNDFAWPEKAKVVYEFAPNKFHKKPVKLFWHDAREKPSNLKNFNQEAIDRCSNGTAVICSKRNVFCDNSYGHNIRIYPFEEFRALKMDNALPEKDFTDAGGNPHREFLSAVLEGKQPGSNIADFSADFTATVLLGLIPNFIPEKELLFDAKRGRFTNSKEANKLLNSRYAYKTEFLPSKI
ncbi:MAG: Gfo/Idh/MocA family oxidoreductase [Opitutales bacterium]|nr:Gfo/Idh/MocA family oxidoreductase [Opitutales bacterium]